MDKKRYFNTRMIATTGVLLALEIALQIIGNYIVIPGGFANLNFSLIFIALGAILYGPIIGSLLGLVSGILTLFSPSTMSVFFTISPVGTVLACLLKTTIAGLVAGIISNLLKKKNDLLSSILSSLVVPILNTGIFAFFTIIFFKPLLAGINPDSMAAALFLGLIGFNFIFELLVTVFIVPSLYKILLQVTSKNKEFA